MFFSPSNQKFSIKLRFNRSKCKKRLSCLSSRTYFSKCHSHTNKQNNSITTKHSRNLTALRFPLYLFFQESQVNLHLSLQPEFYRTCKEKLFTCLKKKYDYHYLRLWDKIAFKAFKWGESKSENRKIQCRVLSSIAREAGNSSSASTSSMLWGLKNHNKRRLHQEKIASNFYAIFMLLYLIGKYL